MNEPEEIVIEYKQHPDGTYSRSLGISPDTNPLVVREMLVSAYSQVNAAMEAKAIEDGFKDVQEAGKDWAFNLTFNDLKGFTWKGDDDEG